MKLDFTENDVFRGYEHQIGYNLSAGYAHFYGAFSQNMGRYCKCPIFMVYFRNIIDLLTLWYLLHIYIYITNFYPHHCISQTAS